MNTKNVLNLLLAILLIGYSTVNLSAHTTPKEQPQHDILDLVEFLVEPFNDGFSVYWQGSTINSEVTYTLDVVESDGTQQKLQTFKATALHYEYKHYSHSKTCTYILTIREGSKVLSTHKLRATSI